MSAKALATAVLMIFSPQQESHNQCYKNCVVTERGYELIRKFEGWSPSVYKDAVGLPTIGYGHLIKPGEKFEGLLSPEESEELLKKDVKPFERHINRKVDVKLYPNQFDALNSFTFNVGSRRLDDSTLLKKVNSGNHNDVPEQFLRWNKAGGKVLKGLTYRRQVEAELYAKSSVDY